MATLRPAKCYSNVKGKPYTRISKRKPRKSYVKGVPVPKIHHYEVGKKDDYGLTSYLISKQNVQIRSNALEAIRVTISKNLAKGIGEKQYFMKILVYPHHVMRENPAATGAGADRYSTGMRRSFGKVIGQTARIKAGQRIIMVQSPLGSEKAVKEALRRGSCKLTGSWKVEMK